MKKFVSWILAIVILLLCLNANTDFFRKFGKYAPYLEENCPDAVYTIEEAAGYVYDFTSVLPTWGEIIAVLKNEELPIDPSDVAVNAYIADSPMLTFNPYENISAKIKDGKYLRLFGISALPEKSHLIVRLSDEENEKLDQVSVSVNSDMEFDKTIEIPDSDFDKISVEVYTGGRSYGEFTSWIYNYLYLTRDESGLWSIMQSPVYTHNKSEFEAEKPISEALKDTPSVENDDPKIMNLAASLCVDADTEYERLLAIHDWVCSNISYDRDKLNSSKTVPYSATRVLENKSAVCLGFATLTAALCRSVGIPCNVVSGYALGIGDDMEWTAETINTDEQNHAWNEAYVDGRWIIMDVTWDCMNKIENGILTKGEPTHLYFDANIDFFSINHKIIEYMKRP